MSVIFLEGNKRHTNQTDLNMILMIFFIRPRGRQRAPLQGKVQEKVCFPLFVLKMLIE